MHVGLKVNKVLRPTFSVIYFEQLFAFIHSIFIYYYSKEIIHSVYWTEEYSSRVDCCS